MAATKTNAVDARLELATRILAAKSPASTAPLASRVTSFFGDRIADTGDSLAELAAGFRAAGRNYVVAKEQAEHRQALRTADRILAYQRQLGQ